MLDVAAVLDRPLVHELIHEPSTGHRAFKIYLSKLKKESSEICKKQQHTLSYFNSEEWKTMSFLAYD